MKKESLRILQLGKFYPIRGGVEKVMYDLMWGLSEQGVDCDMMCASEEMGNRIIEINDHARLICCNAWRKVSATMIAPAMLAKLRSICKDYDIIHVHHPDPMACLALYCSGYRGKVILHWHSDIQKQKWLLKGYLPFQKWLIRRADYIVGTSPVYLKESPFLKKVQDKTFCLPIGVDALPEAPELAETIRKRYGNRKIIFSLGRLVHYKGYRYLVEAARYLDDSYVILIGGSGALRDELATQIERLGLQQKVILLGRISDEELPGYYEACKVFCLSSIQKTEAFGIVQIEAMSCGKPVVATTIPESGVAWVNAQGISGINVEPENAKALADAVMEITKEESVYEKYAMNARKRYEEWFTKEGMIEKCLNLYNYCYE